MAKRKKKVKKVAVKPVKRKTRYYPVIFCLKENKVTGFSVSDIPLKSDKFGRVSLKRKVGVRDWKQDSAQWLSEEHTIDMSQYEDGDMVFCGHCNSAVDFRVFPSNEKPRMISKTMERESKPLGVKK